MTEADQKLNHAHEVKQMPASEIREALESATTLLDYQEAVDDAITWLLHFEMSQKIATGQAQTGEG